MANSNTWNVNRALAALRGNARVKSSGYCARYVRMAIEAGGISTAGRPGSAYLYKGYLPRIGFNFVTKTYGRELQRRWSSQQAKPGDIAVMDHGKHGHICMWDGSRWISDFFQNNMWVYSGEGQCYLYRFNGQIDTSKDWNNWTQPPYQPKNNLFSQDSGQNVYSGPIENASSITIDGDIAQDDEHTRIYAASAPTIIVDDLYMANMPQDANPDAQQNEQTT